MSKKFPGLSKSRLIEWRQCPKRLWLKVHRPDLMETSEETEHAFQVGYEVGEVARKLHPGGILVDTESLGDAVRLTKELLASRPGVPLFEATFERAGVLVRADLLLPASGGYRLVEVKASGSVKDYHYEDAAIQRWVVDGAIPLKGVAIAHVDSGFRYPGGGDYRGLLKEVPVDAETAKLGVDVLAWVEAARETLGGGEPGIETGEQCSAPFDCPFIAYCDAGKPVTDFPLSSLPRLHPAKHEQLEAMGIADVREIPEDFPLSDMQGRVRRVIRSGIPELLPNAGRELAALPYPRYYLDFETVSMAVPVWAGSRPYQKIPVQWSCHIESARGEIEHHAYLAGGSRDPRREFAETLLVTLCSEGPVFVYHQSFENGRLRELAEDLPDLADELLAIVDRVVDLEPITKEAYCHPEMRGSWSIKAVLPTIAADLDYGAMEIGDGGTAEAAWLEILHPDTPKEKRQALLKALADYCALDTLAMVRLKDFLCAPI